VDLVTAKTYLHVDFEVSLIEEAVKDQANMFSISAYHLRKKLNELSGDDNKVRQATVRRLLTSRRTVSGIS